MMQMMGQGMMGPGMRQMMGQGMGVMSTGGPGPAMILRMGDALNLTDEQRVRLQAIQGEYSGSVEPLMAAVMRAHQEAAAALAGDPPDIEAYERALREANDRMVEAHVAMARAAVEARAVLTDEQLGQLEDSIRMMRGMTGMMGSGM
jgi:Spy/CpxP family protein refolding chaperone